MRQYDHVRPSDLDFWLNYVNRDQEWFTKIADTFRRPDVWSKDNDDKWTKVNLWD